VLSRIAESLFWIGRYVERADDTARILEAHLQLLLEDPWVEEDLACRSLLAVMGASEPPAGATVTRADVMQVLAYDVTSPGAIAGALAAARENARRAREIVSTELWECLNTTWNQLTAQRDAFAPHDFFSWIRERAAIVSGLVESGTSRDLTWQFLVLGRSIERADMTARLIATRALSGVTGPTWTTLLRSCGAHESFLRTYRGRASDALAAEFLLLDRSFPRSVLFALQRAERCLDEISPRETRRSASEDDARRILGRARSGLEFRPLGDLLAGLPDEMEHVQLACSAASDAVRGRYFPSPASTAWVGELL
jgi:uncharacterized alpha-E superfamily protein